MESIRSIIQKNIQLRQKDGRTFTLLAVCPNSESVLAAAVKAAAKRNSIMLFAATLNQVDLDGGYTGWTPQTFIQKIGEHAGKYGCTTSLYPCLDHGGPWLKDKDTLARLSFEQTIQNVKNSIEACIKAGYQLLHIDPTVDRNLPSGETIPIEWVVERTVDLIAYAEMVRQGLHLPEISYEVGTEEVLGGMVDLANFDQFIQLLKVRLLERNLSHIWPCFFVAQVGTDLHTTDFDPAAANQIYTRLYPTGALAKGHYTDWVSNPAEYPISGMGGANVGPEFTSEEFDALLELEGLEKSQIMQAKHLEPSHMTDRLTNAVIGSQRWQKWLLEEEKSLDFHALSPERKMWLLKTGARYCWTDPQVIEGRQILFQNLSHSIPDPNEYVVNRICKSIDKYILHFNLMDSQSILS